MVPLRRTPDWPKVGVDVSNRGNRFVFGHFSSLRWLPVGWKRWEDMVGIWGKEDDGDGPTEAGLV